MMADGIVLRIERTPMVRSFLELAARMLDIVPEEVIRSASPRLQATEGVAKKAAQRANHVISTIVVI
jgi:hypothetical protein